MVSIAGELHLQNIADIYSGTMTRIRIMDQVALP